MAAERIRTFTGILPESGQSVLVTIFEEVSGDPGGDVGSQRVLGMEVALKDGEGRFSRWGVPAQMTEEI